MSSEELFDLQQIFKPAAHPKTVKWEKNTMACR